MSVAAMKRGLRGALAEGDDVVDPFGLSDEEYAACLAEITAAVNIVVATVLIDMA